MVKARYNGLKVYYDLETQEIWGRNFFWAVLVNLSLWIDVKILGLEFVDITMEEDG